MKQSKQLALAGMFTALQTVLMFLGSVMWIFCYLAPILCGLIMIILKDSVGIKFSLISYAVCCIIGVLFLPDKECVLMYIFFFGYYTLIREHFEKLPKALSVVLKYLLFNVTIAASQLILVYILHIPFDMGFGVWSVPVFAFLMNFMFFFYERLLPRITLLYEKRYKNKVDRLLK